MKYLMTLLFAGLSSLSAVAQGTVIFANHGIAPNGSSFSTPIYLYDGTTPLNSSYEVALFHGQTTIFEEMSLVAGSTTTISANGLFTGPTLTIPGVPVGDPRFFVVVAWNSIYGSTYLTAFQNGLGSANAEGTSFSFFGTLGDAANPGVLNFMSSFPLDGPVPEPSTFALILFGGVMFCAAIYWSGKEKLQ